MAGLKSMVVCAGWILLSGSGVALADSKNSPMNPQKGTIQQSDYQFTPSRLMFKVGKPVELTLINNGKVMHEFVTDALRDLTMDIEINRVIVEALGVVEFEIPPEGKVVLRFTPEKAGEFAFLCESLKPKDHKMEGMTGKIIFQ